MEEGTKAVLIIGVPLAIGAGALIASVIAGEPAGPPPGPPPICANGETQAQVCPDGSQVITAQCANGQWQLTGNQCPPAPPPGDETETMIIEPTGDPAWTRATYYNHATRQIESWPIASQHIRASITQQYNYEHLTETQWNSAMDQLTALGL